MQTHRRPILANLVVLLVVVLVVLLGPGATLASSLYYEHYGLAEVLERPGIAVLGAIVAINPAKSTIVLRVKKIWGAPGKSTTLQIWSTQKDERGQEVEHIEDMRIEVGKSYELPIYRGVNWTDEHESPIERRVRDYLSFESLAVGQEVVYLGADAVASTPRELEKLDLFFGGKIPGEYPAKAASLRLSKDLDDFDLGQLAYVELAKRKELTAPTLLAPDSGPASLLLDRHWRSLPDRERQAFLLEVEKAYQKAHDIKLVTRSLNLVRFELSPAALAIAATLVTHLDPGDTEQAELRSGVIEQIETKYTKSKAAASPEVVRVLLSAHQPQRDEDVEGFIQYAKSLRRADRALLLDEMFERAKAAMDRHQLTPDEVRLVKVLAEIEIAAPEIKHASALAALPLSTIADFKTRTDLVLPVLNMAIALAQRWPATIATLEAPMDKLLRSRQVVKHKGQSGNPDSTVIETVEDFAGGRGEAFRKICNSRKQD
jgi:hypothetical protein